LSAARGLDCGPARGNRAAQQPVRSDRLRRLARRWSARSIEFVLIRVGDETREISCNARQELVDRLRPIPPAASLVDLFARHGTSSPVERVAFTVPVLLAATLAAGLGARRRQRLGSERRRERLRILEEVDHAEEKYRSLVEGLPLATWIYEAGDRGVTRYVSPQVETMLGYPLQAWAEPDLFSKVLHAEDRERVLAEVERATLSGTPFEVEYRLLARDGQLVWIREQGTTIRGPGGEPLYGRSFLLDIEERKRADTVHDRLLAAERAALSGAEERQRRLDLLREAANLTASSLDYAITIQRVAELVVRDFADWCVVDMSEEGGSERLAIAQAEPRDEDADGGAPDQQTEEAVRAVIESGRPRIVPGLGESSNREETVRFLGGVKARSVICVPLRARGRQLGAVTVARTARGVSYGADELAFVEDLAGRIALAIDHGRLYREVEERADASRVLAHVGDGILFLNRSGIVRLWNAAAERITAISATDVVGRSAVEVIPGWKEAADSVPVSASSDPGQSEVVVPIGTDEGERWIAISGVQFFGGTVYAFRDLTEVRRLEQLRADFVATASHELRTPLAAVYGAAQTLLRHDFALDEGGRDRFVSLIAEESERLSRIVNEILLANQLDAGRLDLESEPFDAVELVERVVESTRAYAPPGISVELAAPERVPQVAADRDKVRQVLVNLVENAIKYSPGGGLVEIGVEPHDEHALFYVKDEGLGIPSEEQSRVFEKFYRVDPNMTRGIGGTGLGLYICAELVSRMRGRIWLESNEQRGSIFLFELPVAESSSVQRSSESAERQAPRSPAGAARASR
jgi:two-component system, OmpR family, phosphate regulon sensor histidine kinase PhoR